MSSSTKNSESSSSSSTTNNGKKKKVRVKKKVSQKEKFKNFEIAPTWEQLIEGLSEEQIQMIEEFTTWLNDPSTPTSQFIKKDKILACKFIRGTKFRIEKAKTKYLAYVELKNEWGDCSLEVVAPFLATGAQMLPPWAVDNEGRQILFVTAENLNPKLDVNAMRAKAADYMFNLFLQYPQFQEQGNVLVLDLKNASMMMSNRQAQNEMNRLIQATPCRLGSGSIMHPPWFFSILFKIVSSILPAKIIGRIKVRSESELHEIIPKENLLPRLGGDLQFDHRAWLKRRFEIEKKAIPDWLANDLPPPEPTE